MNTEGTMTYLIRTRQRLQQGAEYLVILLREESLPGGSAELRAMTELFGELKESFDEYAKTFPTIVRSEETKARHDVVVHHVAQPGDGPCG